MSPLIDRLEALIRSMRRQASSYRRLASNYEPGSASWARYRGRAVSYADSADQLEALRKCKCEEW